MSSTAISSTLPTSSFSGFGESDFKVFEIAGLEPRMDALITQVRPKLHQLGNELSGYLSQLCGEEIFPHVAKHARRKVNPPNDTWVAFANNKRGYKAYPHFQIGLWASHVFIQFAIIYECPSKQRFAERALKEISTIRKTIPSSYVWSKDHMVPTGLVHSELSKDELAELFTRLKTVKAAELTCGIHIGRHDALLADEAAFIAKAEQTFASVLPLYKLAMS
ncbi:MAG: DUF1054 domain-containing protein [Candidatus Cohnella colombiensis]|uniref:UPF0637 protein P0Y55_09810 n=1 Tax=Candidatus Cohnella colombiensis TaxID=3121368 RepID=A0AA95EVX2_9BACL|nr:MAG: DUF1054 domain-containing protein [Cohnella sp.]